MKRIITFSETSEPFILAGARVCAGYSALQSLFGYTDKNSRNTKFSEQGFQASSKEREPIFPEPEKKSLACRKERVKRRSEKNGSLAEVPFMRFD